jgi:hypothetical protein
MIFFVKNVCLHGANISFYMVLAIPRLVEYAQTGKQDYVSFLKITSASLTTATTAVSTAHF